MKKTLTALMVAAWEGKLDVVLSLQDAWAAVNVRDKRGQTTPSIASSQHYNIISKNAGAME